MVRRLAHWLYGDMSAQKAVRIGMEWFNLAYAVVHGVERSWPDMSLDLAFLLFWIWLRTRFDW
ncbi:hypothetical protein [Alicyclobacillus sp.]|uniref:hypothetical protein n=1 Tax=Alicyclobacillus sp. TaxID=61169 RepID=UPI0025BB685C|nr:hypothetical protein [Alicyclobacillus sp.]MCL6515894.1 hypothetical protein [Alicyclobacillus sp.]